MKRRKIFTVLLSVLLLVSLLAGCSAGKQDISESTAADNSDVTSSEAESKSESQAAESNDESTELKYLRLQIKENNALVGVAYLDFLTDTRNVSENSLAVDRISSAMFDKYPFLERCPISFNEGNVAFAVVPASRNATVTIYRSSIDEEGMYKDETDKPLLKSEDGSPLVFLCDDNENYSNILVSVKDGDKTVEFRPMISLENGRDIVLTDGCYDFTYWDMRGYSDESFYYLSACVDEISEGLVSGMSLSYDSEEFMYNHYALKYKLGTYNDDGSFDCKKEYLIDEYYTMVREPGELNWAVVCGGLDLERVANIMNAEG